MQHCPGRITPHLLPLPAFRLAPALPAARVLLVCSRATSCWYACWGEAEAGNRGIPVEPAKGLRDQMHTGQPSTEVRVDVSLLRVVCKFGIH